MGRLWLGVLLIAAAIAALTAGPATAACPIDNPDCDEGPTPPTINTLTVTAPSSGTITGSGISCPGDCSQFYSYDAETEEPPTITLTAASGPPGYTAAWFGCTPSGATCDVFMDQDRSVSLAWQDTTAPTVSLQTVPAKVGPANAGLASTATDNSGLVTRVQFLVDGVLITDDTFAPFAASLPIGSYSHGSSHQARARAFDAAGNQSSLTPAQSFTVDRQASVGASTPAASVASAPAIDLTPDADVPAGNITCTTSKGATVTGVTSPCSSPYTAQTAGDGDYTVTIQVTDDVGNTATVTRTFTLTAPSSGGDGGGTTGGGGGDTTGGDPTGGGAAGPGSDPAVAEPTLAALAGALKTDLNAAAKRLAKQRWSKLRRVGRFSFFVRSLAAGRITGAITSKGALAKASMTAGAAGRYKITLKLTKKGKRVLRRGKRLKVRLTIGFTGADGVKVSRSKRVTLKRR
jgi:hypothetical protein